MCPVTVRTGVDETRRRARRRVGACLILLSLHGCARGPLEQSHPLEGVIVDGVSGETISRSQLVDEMAAADVVLLGEKHDNAEHHRYQRWALEALLESGRRPALGLEVFSVGQTSLLMDYVLGGRPHGSVQSPEARLRAALGWGPSRDETWQHYGPLLVLAREHGLTVFGIDLPVALRRRISRVGVDGLSAVERSQVPDAGTAPPEYRAFMLENIRRSHCGHGSERYLERLFENWQARNETMARAVATAAAEGAPVVVVLGGAHVRHGGGVVPRLAARLPGVRQLNVGLEEVDPKRRIAADYPVAGGAVGGLPDPSHDRIWLTARDGLDAEAACARFEKVLKKQG